MKKRIFIAINLPEGIKKQLANFQQKWPEIPARWTDPKNIHITLSFLGYVADQELYEISKIVKQVAAEHEPFEIKLDKICYGPRIPTPLSGVIGTLSVPRMIWATGEKSKEFSDLKNNLDKSLRELAPSERSESRGFSPHITLCRIREWEWRRIEPEERPEIDEDINFTFDVNSIEIMESQLKRGGSEYSVFESFQLGKS